VAAARKGTGLTIELYASFDSTIAGPWRFNFAASRATATGAVAIAKFGDDDVAALVHGVLILLDEER
jgi:hypothetical protein